MSEEGSNLESQEEISDSNQESKEQFVAKKAYEEVSKDMHKYKSQNKEIAARANELEAKLKSIEEEKMVDEKRWQELYEKEKEERAQIDSARKQDFEMFMKTAKKSALKQELGGQVKDIFLDHAAIDEIEVKDDGTLNSESVLKVANQFRKDYPEVIPSNESMNISGNASPTQLAQNSNPNDLSAMSFEQKAQLLKQLKNK